MTPAVVDSGPIIHLREAGALSLLSSFSPLSAPEEVWREVVEHGKLLKEELLDVGLTSEPAAPDVDEFIQREGLDRLHRGEQACLRLCRHLGITTLLTDDLAAREAATRLSVAPVGSLGVIVRAYRVSRISLEEAERLLLRLHAATSLFVTPAIVELAIERLRSSRP